MAKRDDVEDDYLEDEVDESEQEDEEYEEEEEEYEESSRSRFIPALVVTAVVAAFGALAWHSYRSGSSAVKDDDVLLIEAEKSPLKEKPEDPGGMKFPHQDKTVFDTIASNPQKPAPVERVMPQPEEPVNTADANNTQKPWVNDKLQADNTAVAPSTQQPNIVSNREAVALAEKAPSAGTYTPSENTEQSNTSNTIAASESSSDSSNSTASAPTPAIEEKSVEIKEVPVKTVAEEKHKPAPKAESHKQAHAEKMTEKKLAKQSPSAGGGANTVQLGAFKSEAEAKNEWGKISKKFGSLLADKTVYYVKAELPKGTFYRLRASGFSDAKDACSQMSSKGQACMVINGK